MDRATPPGNVHGSVTLDGFDLRLLARLQEDGRLTNMELAERVGLSASQCSRRRTALEKAGVIRGYEARLSADLLGFGMTVLIQVTLSSHSGDNARRFRDLVARVDAIQDAFATTGDADYLLKAVLPDLKALSVLMNETLLAHESVAQVRSSLVLERLKETARLPVTELRRGCR